MKHQFCLEKRQNIVGRAIGQEAGRRRRKA
jgi:hypothetical protein